MRERSLHVGVEKFSQEEEVENNPAVGERGKDDRAGGGWRGDPVPRCFKESPFGRDCSVGSINASHCKYSVRQHGK